MAQAGFRDAESLAERIDGFLGSAPVAAGGARLFRNLIDLLNHALGAIGHRVTRAGAYGDVGADEVLRRLLRLLEILVPQEGYVRLFVAYSEALDRLLNLLASSRWATDFLCRHPLLLDELIDFRLLQNEPDWVAWSTDLEGRMTGEDLGQPGADARAMDLLRDAHRAQLFRLLISNLEGRLTVDRLGQHLSGLADASVAIALAGAWHGIEARHRDVPAFAVIAYGKLGGLELGYASDLDLVLVFDDDQPEAEAVYTMLARRMVHWLSEQTAHGSLFEVDLRLRPNGDAGLPACSFTTFERYLRNDDGFGAWTWELQALTRARFCAGDAGVGRRFEALRSEVICTPRDAGELASQVLAMRQKMHDGRTPSNGRFDLKHDRGGLIDLEFVVQYLVLAHAAEYSRLARNVGTAALLRLAGSLDLIPSDLANRAAGAYQTFRSLQHRLRLNGLQDGRVQAAEAAVHALAVHTLWNAVFAQSTAGTLRRAAA